MKIYIPILFLVILLSCRADQKVEKITLNFDNLDSAKNDFFNPEPDFPEYVFLPQDTSKTNKNELGHFNEIIPIGQISIDSNLYNVHAIFKTISFINHYKIRSTLSLISEENDTLQFEASKPEELPIDIYQNHFVFLNMDQTYTFSKASMHENELLCFDYDGHCFLQD